MIKKDTLSRMLPSWMSEKVARLVRREQRELTFSGTLFQMEYRSAICLQSELQVDPSLAEVVSEDFRIALCAGTGSNLNPLERASIVILEEDAVSALPDKFEAFMSEFLKLKWEALASLLKGGADA
ncbi:MAG: hypothetical protein ACYC1A_02360 [Spirochaetales bacterium]